MYRQTFRKGLSDAALHTQAKLKVPYDPGHPGLGGDVALRPLDDGQTWMLVHGAGRDLDGIEATWDDCLHDFIGLSGARGSPEAIRDFAQRYGSLLLCEHPAQNPFLARAVYRTCKACDRQRKTFDGTEPHEPLDAWHATIRQARAALRIAVSLRRGETVNVDDAAAVFAEPERFARRDAEWSWASRTSPNAAARLVCDLTNAWCREGAADLELRPALDTEEQFQLHIEGKSLLGALGRQLAVTLSSLDRVYYCSVSECKNPLPSGSKPRRGHPPLCKDHRAEADLARRRLKYDTENPVIQRKRKPR